MAPYIILLAAAAAIGAFLIGLSIPSLLEVIQSRDLGAGEDGAEGGERTNLIATLSRPFEGMAARRNQPGSGGLSEELSRAGLRIKSQEWILIQVACAFLFGAIAFIRFQFSLLPIVFAIIGWVAPVLYLSWRKSRRLHALNDQLVDTVNILSSALKAGHSLPQAMDMVAKTSQPPISEEFARVMHELDIGGGLDSSLEKMVRRVQSEDMEIIATAAIIHHQAGGNLATTLDTISDTIRDRIRVRGEISAMTAQSRLSGWFITALPIILFLLILWLDNTYFQALFSAGLIGYAVLLGCAISIFTGNYIIRRIVRVDV